MTAARVEAVRIVEGGLDDPRVVELLQIHVTRARAETAPGSSHALDLSGLRAPEVSFWSAWEGETVVGVGALKRLAAHHGEIKSMHTAEAARGRGVGSAMLRHIMAAARAGGMARLSLETGSWPYFEPARTLYARHGFVVCGPFGEYREDPNSVFMTAELHLQTALDEARQSLQEGGIPIGSVLASGDRILGRGHNRRVQAGSVVLHAEMDALERAGRQPASVYRSCTLYTTLSPCAMCTGAILLYGIPRVVVGENRTFRGEEDLLRSRGVVVEVIQDPACERLLSEFIGEHPELWNEDIGR